MIETMGVARTFYTVSDMAKFDRFYQPLIAEVAAIGITGRVIY